jgi:hypothetical protein
LSQSLCNNEEDMIAAAVPQNQQQPAPVNNPPAPTIEDAMNKDSNDSSDDSDDNNEQVEALQG